MGKFIQSVENTSKKSYAVLFYNYFCLHIQILFLLCNTKIGEILDSIKKNKPKTLFADLRQYTNYMDKDNSLNLPLIEATPKSGNEKLTYNGENLGYKLLDFWQWSVSDILSNATRGRFAEFIVGTAIQLDRDSIRDEWGSYDLESKDGIKIEVKSASYIQSWYQKDYSTISFSIKPAKYWDAENGMSSDVAKRHADIYVFCLLQNKNQENIDPMKLEQWTFFVLPTYKIDGYTRSRSSITLKSLLGLANEIQYSELKEAISIAYLEQMKNKK